MAFSTSSAEEGWQKQTTASEFLSNQRPTKSWERHGAVCFSQCLVATWLLGEHESWMTRRNLGVKYLHTGKFWKCNLAISEKLCFCWRILISNVWMLVRNLLLPTWCLGNFESNLVSPADAPPSFPGTLSEIRVHDRHTWIHPAERRWSELKSWHDVTSCRRGWFLA